MLPSDPFGILEEDEIHFKSSQDLKDACLDLNPKSVTGDVLVGRVSQTLMNQRLIFS